MTDLVTKYLTAFSTATWGDMRSLLAPDCFYEEMPSRRRSVGPDACVATVQRWKSAFPDLRATILRSYLTDHRVCCEIEWTGTHTAVLDHTFGVVAPTHRSCRVNAIMVFATNGSKIAEMSSYFDLLSVFAQLGVSPTFEIRGLASVTEHARP